MSHASIPDFSVPLTFPPVCVERVPFHADPILAAINAHEEAYAVFQVAIGEAASMAASEDYDAARMALLGTPCATREGAFCLLRHLRWWLDQESGFADDYQPAYAIAQAREADLTLLLGVDGIRRIPVALPLGRLVSVPVDPIPPMPLRTAVRTPLVIKVEPVSAPALARLGRAASSAGETLTAIVLIVGGTVLTGLATLV